MDVLTFSDLGLASQINVKSFRANSPSLIQVASPSSSGHARTQSRIPQQRIARNFSKKLYSPEPCSRSSSRGSSGEISPLAAGLSILDYPSAQPLTPNGGLSTLEQSPLKLGDISRSSSRSSVISSPAALASKRSSVPSTPVVSKPVRPSFGRSISMLDSVSATAASAATKQVPAPAAQMIRPHRPAFTRSPMTTMCTSQAPQSPSSTFANTVGEKLGWLRSRAFSNSSVPSVAPVAAPLAVIQQVNEDADLVAADPLINLDISAALFPTGIVDFTDSASFNELLANATALIETLQTAYKQRTLQVNKLRADFASQAEDLDEAELRSRHLRMQLSNISARMTETEMSLRRQLAEECQLRKALEIRDKEREARRRTNPYQSQSRRNSTSIIVPATAAAAAAVVVVGGTATSPTTSTASDSCDSGFESDAESHYSSRFSSSSSSSSSIASNASCTSDCSTTASTAAAAAATTRMTTPQPFSSMRTAAAADAPGTPDLVSGCTSPTPSDALWERRSIASAFDPVAENCVLRHRVAELEGAVEACLRLI